MAIFSRPIPGLRFAFSLLSLAAVSQGSLAAGTAAPVPLPDTISPEARAVIEFLRSAGLKQLKAPAPDDLAAWKSLHEAQEKALEEPNRVVLEQTGATVTPDTVGGVPVLEITPKGWTDDGRAIVYIHGGAFTLFSARSMAGLAALMAKASGMRVISIDYTNPPAVHWDEVQRQVGAVLDGLSAKSIAINNVALFADSAGGNLALRALQVRREQGAPLPAALVLFSPWADLTDSGDTAITLAEADPTLSYDGLLANSARAYAGTLDLKDPRVSPLYSKFGNDFPPTLIQDGTRTILLSDSVRVYRALRDGGADATIDLYEGMWHVFQGAPAPEAAMALGSAGAFVRAHLR